MPKDKEVIEKGEIEHLEVSREYANVAEDVVILPLPDISKFSSRLRLIRSTALMLRFIRKSRKNVNHMIMN